MPRSGSSRGHTVLMLKELHLTPHYIYMINEQDYIPAVQYILEMYKGISSPIPDEKKLAETN
jgi:hypothetical protein